MALKESIFFQRSLWATMKLMDCWEDGVEVGRPIIRLLQERMMTQTRKENKKKWRIQNVF